MSKTVTIGLFYEHTRTVIELLQEQLEAAGYTCRVFSAETPRKSSREHIARVDILVVMYPSEVQTALVLGLAEGMQKNIVVLTTPQTDWTIIPRGAKTVPSNRQLLNQVRLIARGLGKTQAHVQAEHLDSYGVCPTAVDWFRTHFPKGARTAAWTPEVQRRLLLNGGAPWVQGGQDFGFVDLFPLEGADYSNQKLDGLRLEGLELSGLNLSGSEVGSAKLSGSNLSGAKLRDADLSDARLRGSTLSNADFSHANLTQARLDGSKADGADFTKAICRETVFHNANLANAVFAETVLSDSSFRGAILDHVDFTSADTTRTDFRGAKIDMAIFGSSQIHALTLRMDERDKLLAGN